MFQPSSPLNVDITSKFWSDIQARAREKTIPAILEAQKSSKHWQCLTWKRDNPIKPHPFWDSDIYKWTEAACNFLLKHPDKDTRQAVDEAVSMIESAQHDDGYLNSYYTVRGIENRWTNLRDMHELYCLGHLIEATVAYEILTKSGTLLDVVRKAMNHVTSVFGRESGKLRGYPGHEEIEIGLVRLFELTKDSSFLGLARYFITERGQRDEHGEVYFDREARARGGDPYDHMGPELKHHYLEPRDYGYHQADCPIENATEVKGHSVRAMYFYTAVTDFVRLESGNGQDMTNYSAALDRLWRDLVDKKMYITGGIGSITQNEGFGPAYQLPDLEKEGCYSETCATFAMINWCQRLLRLRLNSEYADVMEVGLYNAFLGAVAVEGDAFYYQNVLRTRSGQPKERSKWFGVACCPPNVAKLLGSLETLVYSFDSKDKVVAVHLYIESSFKIPDTSNAVSTKTNMPWSGDVTIKVQQPVNLALRIPGWAVEGEWTCSTKGEVKDGYLHIRAEPGQDVKLNLPMQPQKVYAHPETGKDEVAFTRGPLVYCIENIDNKDVDIDHLALIDGEIREGDPISVGPVEGIVPIVARGREVDMGGWKNLYGSKPWQYKKEEKEVVAIPYFLRANRGGKGAMRAWTPILRGQIGK